jgi:hypothetical protein
MEGHQSPPSKVRPRRGNFAEAPRPSPSLNGAEPAGPVERPAGGHEEHEGHGGHEGHEEEDCRSAQIGTSYY